ncbi:MAG: glycosyltransferase [Thermoplasmataceae archaeon]
MMHVVIIPTSGRPGFVKHALESVIQQSVVSNLVLVVYETHDDIAGVDLVMDQKGIVPIVMIRNERSHNLPGALNQSIIHLLSLKVQPNNTLVSFLDDDDTWEPGYLVKIRELVIEEKLSMAYSGIIRHETGESGGILLTIPDTVEVSDFLTGNPHIQLSNLSLRLSTLLKAGMFDENLESTVDRDLIIRVLELGNIRYNRINEHLVHHNAWQHARLSTYGNPKKLRGLQNFYVKHSPSMTPDERGLFKKRALVKFGCVIPEQFADPTDQGVDRIISGVPETPELSIINLVVGFTTSNPDDAVELIHDIDRYSGEIGVHSLTVICDNTTDSEMLQRMVSNECLTHTEIRLIKHSRIEEDSISGKFGDLYQDESRRKGIPFGRTALHYYLYMESLGIPYPIYWILDGDIRLYHSGNDVPINPPDSFRRAIHEMRKRNIPFAIGKIAGDPPIPAESMIRTQLLDLFYCLKSMLRNDTSHQNPLPLGKNSVNIRSSPDYYYDNAMLAFGHLETPAWKMEPEVDRAESLSQLIIDSRTIIKGVSVFRKIPPSATDGTISFSPHAIPRGGNTIVADRKLLRLYPNIAPFLRGNPLRRGDTLWEITSFLSPEYQEEAKTGGFAGINLTVFQSRLNNTRSLSLDNLTTDIFGGAFTRAFEMNLRRKGETIAHTKNVNDPDWLKFSANDVQNTIEDFEENVRKRVPVVESNIWRTIGLVESIEFLMKSSSVMSMLETMHDGQILVSLLDSVLSTIRSTFNEENLEKITSLLDEYGKSDLQDYIYNLQGHMLSYRNSLPFLPVGVDFHEIKQQIQEYYGVSKLEFVGSGEEGVIFTDGINSYKWFYSKAKDLSELSLSFAAQSLEKHQELKFINPLKRIVDIHDHIVAVSDYVRGTKYHGGHIAEILEFLRECRTAGIVITNISPENIVVSDSGLKYVDFGRSIEPYTETKFVNMCKRAFLTIKFSFRPDLKVLLHKTLTGMDFPELFGWEYLLKATEVRITADLIDEQILRMISLKPGDNVLDYGCGDGRVSRKLRDMGYSVSAYDTDMSKFSSRGDNVGIEDVREVPKDSGKYRAIICSLVLCTISDDKEFRSVLRDLRKLIATNGTCVISVCNPLSTSVRKTCNRINADITKNYEENFQFKKIVLSTHNSRTDFHRPVGRYIHEFNLAGFQVDSINESDGADTEDLLPSSDFIFFKLRPIDEPREYNVSLMIKASSMEWKSIEWQVRHIVTALEGPVRFREKVVVTDTERSSFARQYTSGDFNALEANLKRLVADGVIDRYIVAPDVPAEISAISSRWFGLDSISPKSKNGQQTITTLYGFEQCTSRYILQVDSDCIIGYKGNRYDYLKDAIGTMEKETNAITVSLPIFSDKPSTLELYECTGAQWRLEVRCSLIHKERLLGYRPYENSLENGILSLPWHRSVDRMIWKMALKSYRYHGNIFFIHVPNSRKTDINEWYNIVKAVERGVFYNGQEGNVNLVGSLEDWIGRRSEYLQVITRGQNVSIGRLRRCIESINRQSARDFGVIYIDAGSQNESLDYLTYILPSIIGNHFTLYLNKIPLSPSENIDNAIRHISVGERSIIMQVDADDALIDVNAIRKIAAEYSNGADATAGSMQRTDKARRYFIDFKNARVNRGGNVWVHPRTFLRKLFLELANDALKMDGNWIEYSEDWAYMIPISELAEKPTFIEDVIYQYDPSSAKAKRPKDKVEATISRILSNSKPFQRSGSSSRAVR